MMGGTCFTSFYSSFIQDLHSTGSPGVPLLKAEYTKKRRRRFNEIQHVYCILVTSHFGYVELWITRSIFSIPLDFEITRLTCISLC